MNFRCKYAILPVILLTVALAASASDVSYFGVVKSIQTLQTNSSYAPVALSSNGYAFTAFAVASTNDVLTNATVKPGSGTLRTLAPTTNNTYWLYTQQFNSQSALDSAFPAGSIISEVSYAMTLSTVHDGVKSASLTFFLLTALTYPAAGQIANLVAAQSIDTTADFTLSWGSLGGSSLTIAELSVLDASSNVLFMTPAPFQTGALNGSSTSATIPAYTLPPGATLTGHLTVANPGLPNTSSYSGATGVAALAVDTQFTLTTRPTPAPPRLSVPAVVNGKPQIRLTGETNRIYQILVSTNLGGWTNVFTTNCTAGAFVFTDTNSITGEGRCYRAKVGK